MIKPSFFVVGAPKCGTTSLYEYLKQHPRVFLPERKDLAYFIDDLDVVPKPRSVAEYEAFFREGSEGQIAGDVSVWYLYSHTAAERIHAYCPHAKILIMLRDPVGMLYSLHSEYLFSGDETLLDFEQALDAEDARRSGADLGATRYPKELFYYRQVVRYAEQVERYFDRFGRENCLFIDFHRLKNEADRVYVETLELLELETDFQPVLKQHNPAKVVRSRRLASLMKNPPWPIRLAASLVPKSVLRRVAGKAIALNAKPQPRPPMDPELRRRLSAELTPEVRRLEELLGLSLAHWPTLSQSD